MQAHIRWMIRRDMPQILAIENRCFDDPWTEEDFIKVLRRRNCIGMVAEDSETERIVGYMTYELEKQKLELLSLAVDKDFRRNGIGKQMIGKLTMKLSPDRRNVLTVLVRETNLGAQLFFRQMGFRAVNIVRNAYDDTDEAAYYMRYRCREMSDVF